MQTDKPLVVVTGATGQQGGSVVRFLLKDGGFRLRAITRKPESEKAKELVVKGVEVVKADFEDLESLVKAFHGAYGTFGVTNYWEDMDAEREIRLGKALVDAAKLAGIKHFVWSSVNSCDELDVPHMNSKAAVNDYLIESGVPRTSVLTSSYYENFVIFPFFAFKKEEDGTYVADWPYMWSDGPIGGYSVADTGAYVLEAFKNPQKWINNELRLGADVYTPREYVQALNDFSGQKVVLKEVDEEAFEKAKGVPGLEEVWTNMKYFYINGGIPGRDSTFAQKIYPERKGMRDFVRENHARILSNLR